MTTSRSKFAENQCGIVRKVTGPTVWVLQDDGTKNLFPAAKFGTLTTFTRKEMLVFDPALIEKWVDELGTWLSFYNPDTDLVLLIGDPVLISGASALLALMFSNYTVLKWDRQSKDYIPVQLWPGKGVEVDWVI